MEVLVAKFLSPRCKTVTWRIEASAFEEMQWQAEQLWSPPFIQDKPKLGRMVLNASPTKHQFGFQMLGGTTIAGRVYINSHFALSVEHTFAKKAGASTMLWDLRSFLDVDEPMMVQVDFDVIRGPTTVLLAELTSE